jgi:hypothetical protein
MCGFLLAVVAIAVGTALPAAAAPAGAGLDYPALARRIVAQVALRPGEKVLLVGYPGVFAEIVAPLRYEVVKAGGVDLGCWMVLPLPPPAGSGVEVPALMKALDASRAALREKLRDVDVAIMLPGATPASPEYAAMQDVLREGHGRTVHFHWNGFDSPSAMPLPGHAVPDEAVIDAIYQRAVLASDCMASGEMERRFANELRGASKPGVAAPGPGVEQGGNAPAEAPEVHVTTPEGTDLRWRSGERPANLQDGDASAARAGRARVQVDREIEIPCGVMRVAPIEESVSGTIVFPPATWHDKAVGAVRLRIERGRVTEITGVAWHGGGGSLTAESGNSAPASGSAATGSAPGSGANDPSFAAALEATRVAVEAELEAGGASARWFREFALGFNPELAVPAATPFIPYYGYGAGVVRLSLGDNSEIGGAVKGPYTRWNFFADATVVVGGRTWVRDGKLLAPPG